MSKPAVAKAVATAPLVMNVGDRVARLNEDTMYARTVTKVMSGGRIEVAVAKGARVILENGSYRVFSRVAEKTRP